MLLPSFSEPPSPRRPSPPHRRPATAPIATKPIVRPTAKQKLLTVRPAQRTKPPARKSHRTSHPASNPVSNQGDWNLPTGGKVLYLTFDDGPQREWTPKVLQVLAKHHAKATFFVLGREAAAHPDLVEHTRSLATTSATTPGTTRC